MNHQPYPHYKPSGVDWLGDIPQHWEVNRIKTVIEDESNGIWGDEAKGDENDVFCLRVADFDKGFERLSTENNTIRNIAKTDYEKRKLQSGDLLIEKSGGGELLLVGRVGLFTWQGRKAVCSNFVARLRPNQSRIISHFLRYFFKNLYAGRVNFRSVKQTTGIQNLDTYSYFNELIALPPLTEQTAIADYLDHQTARIDELLAQKRELISLLQEERAELINEAVTQGLDNHVPRKNSGLPWLGQIPAHWEVKKLKYVVKDIIDTAHKTVPFKENGDHYVVRTSDIRKGNLLIDNMRRTDKEGYLEWTERATPEEGDIFFTREAPAGEACVVPGNLPVCLGQRMVLFRTDKSKILAQFVVYQIYSTVVDEYVCQLSQGSTVSHFNMADIRNMPLVLPNVFEQAQIVSHLDTETARIDDTIKTVEQEIDLLTEYRSALISEVVTGKVRVS